MPGMVEILKPDKALSVGMYLLVWSGGSSTTKDSGVTPEISFVSNGILNGENQHSKMEF